MKLLLGLWAVAALWGHPGWGLVEDRAGNLYVGDVVANVVWRIAADGKVEAVARGRHAHAMCVDAAGVVWGDHTDYDAATKRFTRSHWRLKGEGAETLAGGCAALDKGRPAVAAGAPRVANWEVYVALEKDGGWVVLEHAPIDTFERRLKGKEPILRVRRVDARGGERILLVR